MMTRKRFVVPAAAAAGAAVAYLFDPDRGRRRRAIARDKMSATFRKLARRTGQRARYAEGRIEGAVHAFRPDGMRRDADDITLKHKIESEVLRDYEPGAVDVNVDDGVAFLRGQLRRPDDVRTLERDVSRVPGIRAVENLVHTPR